MIKIYVRRIKAGQMSLEEVPELWRKQVEEYLNASK